MVTTAGPEAASQLGQRPEEAGDSSTNNSSRVRVRVPFHNRPDEQREGRGGEGGRQRQSDKEHLRLVRSREASRSINVFRPVEQLMV